MKEALLQYLEEVTEGKDEAGVMALLKVFKLVRNFIFLKDLDKEVEDLQPTKLSLEKKRIIE